MEEKRRGGEEEKRPYTHRDMWIDVRFELSRAHLSID